MAAAVAAPRTPITSAPPLARGALVALTALSLSVGWGIRGNFGHEWGAMIPGALAAMAAVLVSGRDDWQRRIAYFGAFGAVGWSFGGSISYMQVIGYTHSGHSPSVLYGFASLFVIGFCWAFMGGAGFSLPAFLSREKLTQFFLPLLCIYSVWIVHEFTYDATNVWLAHVLGTTFIARGADYRQDEPLYWFDTDWTSVVLALVTVLIYAALRRKWDTATSLITHMTVGWWAGFLLLVAGLGVRMTPPRGDNWAGCVGMVAGLLVFFQRNRLHGAAFTSLVTGTIGGLGFAGATMLKLLNIMTGYETNWHSVLEQSYGLINGLGVAAATLAILYRAPRVTDGPPVRRWDDPFAAGFVLLGITYLNAQKNIEEWVKQKVMPESMVGITAWLWFNLFYIGLAVAFVLVVRAHQRKPLPILATSWLARGEALYLLLLWWMVVANFERALPRFTAQRLVTEGVITLNAIICTALVLLYGASGRAAPVAGFDFRPLARRAAGMGIAASVLSSVLFWGIIRAVWGNTFAGHASLHIRFGPNATVSPNPKKGVPHP
jgi:hypothetical protein